MNYEGRAASLVTLIDITKRKHAEDELRRTRTFLDTIVENMPAILTVKDARDKRYVLVNRAAERAFGVPSAEMVGKRADEIFSKQTAAFVDNSDREVAESGTLHAAEEQPFETPHNGVRLFNTKKLLVRGADSDAQYLLSLSEDVTDRKRARDQIAHMALHDTLTDLPNRAAFNEKLAATLAAAAQATRPSRCSASTSTGSRRSTTCSVTRPATRCCARSAAGCARRPAERSSRASAATNSR